MRSLDGEELARTDNMFRRYAFDITKRLRPNASHVLAIRFDPPALAAPARPLPVWSAFTDRVSRSRRNQMRKAQFGWGWDWGPDLPTVGVWKPARIEVRPAAKLTDVGFATLSASKENACIRIDVGLDNPHSSPLTLSLTLTAPDGSEVFCHHASENEGAITAELVQHRLWWTADLGDQPLYELVVRLFDQDLQVDEIRRKVGIRTIAIDESPDPDEPGATFRFLLNQVPIFAKGACWVPASSFVGDIDAEAKAYARLIDQTVRANMNMIRVWGGGIYEPDLFYDLCDQAGVLVWQDFMFACAHYPEDGDFANSVRAEVEDQVRRLRHHACLAVWCGNNESQAMNRINADLGGEPVSLSGLALYDSVIPQVLSRLAPESLYRPGSPWGGPNPNSMMAGDVHDWTVWHGLPPIPDQMMVGEYATTPEGLHYLRYAEDKARFVSEFGIQAAPSLATLQRWLDPADLAPDSPGFLQRIKDEARKADAMMSLDTGLPADIQDYVDFTQWIQAEGLKFGIEHFRRRRPHCSGALLWQLNDCWPCVSWSLIDYDGVEKAAYHAVRRAFAPVLASFKNGPNDEVELWITNDTGAVVCGDAMVSFDRFEGTTEWCETFAFSAPANGHVVAWRGRAPKSSHHVLRVASSDGVFEPNRQFSVPVRHLALASDMRPSVTIERLAPASLSIRLTSSVHLPFVHLVSDRPDLRFSDNHFDLAAGEVRTIAVTGSTPFGPRDVTVRCWNDRLRTPIPEFRGAD
ncbi:glycoside hydrolase family 2 protein [Brevundimonas sp.]|uniref:glycoside hydrolase family 2 protein n=1 Tax=Brevundimonas sp. TaxID=1871086 RepID=UPI003917ED59